MKQIKGIKNHIILYTLPKCIFCKEIKHHLNHLNIQYTEINALDPYYSGHIDEIENKYKTNQYPIVIINTINKYKNLIDVNQEVFLLSSDLDASKNIHILNDINLIIEKIKQF